MTTDQSTPTTDDSYRHITLAAVLRSRGFQLGLAVSLLVCVSPVQAASSGAAFCETALAETIKNLFSLIQFGGPLLGGVLAMGTAVAMPAIRSVDRKEEIREIRNQAVVWGIIVAPLGTSIIKFLINDVVAGGASCGF